MGYRMKGFSGFKSSPAKVSDSEVVQAQKRLDKIETSYRAPGCAKAAGAVHANIMSGGMAKASGKGDVAEDIDDRPAAGGGGGGGGGGEKKQSVGAIASEMKQGIGDAKSLMQEVKGIGQHFGNLFKGSGSGGKSETPGPGSTEPAFESYEDFKGAGYN